MRKSTRKTTKSSHFSPYFIKRLSSWLVLSTGLTLATASVSEAAILTWDPSTDGGATAGGGNWIDGAGPWFNGGAAIWSNANPDSAIFGGAGVGPFNVTVDATGITAAALTFNTSDYVIAGPGTLTLAGAATVTALGNATISATLAGTAGLTLGATSTSTLTLSGNNSVGLTGAITVNGGTLAISADNNLGAAANTVTVNGGILQSTGTFASARALTLGASGGTVDVTGVNNLTLSTAVAANANALTKTGNGTLTLGAASTRTGTSAVNGGRLAVTVINAAGSGAVTVNGATATYEINTAAATSAHVINVNNGGTFQWTQNAQLTLAPALNVTGTGGTIFVGGSGSTGKILAGTGLITSTVGSTTTKTGGGVLQLAGVNAGFLGDLSLQAGTVEFQNADSLGTAVKTVTIGGTGDLATGAAANRNNIVLTAGGTLSANNAAADYTGTVTVNGSANVALRQFQTVANAISFRISGPLSGSGNLAVAAPAAATLTLAGNNSAYSGVISAGTNATVVATTKQTIGTGGYGLTGGTVRVQAQNNTFTLGSNGLNATYYNFGSNPGIASTQFAGDQLYLIPRSFNRVDARPYVPQAGAAGDTPIIPVPGFAIGTGATGAVSDGFMWKGLLNITNAGSYTFKGTDDDNLILYIDGVQVGTLGVVAALTNINATPLALSAGSHSIVIKHSNGTGGGYATVLYNGGAGSDAPTDEILGTDAGSVTTGSLDALNLGPVTMTASSTLDLLNDATTGSLSLGNGTLTVTSQTLNNLTVGATTITAATPTLAVQNNKVTFTGAIGDGGSGFGLTLAGPGLTEFQATNTYVGATTVIGGQLFLNAAGGNSIGGDITINAANANGDIANVKLGQSEQIADGALLTMTSGILDLGVNSEFISALSMNGGRIIGSGTLTVLNLGALTQTGGTIGVSLDGLNGLNKAGTGTLILSGANAYQGVTFISNGTLRLHGGTLGSGGVGNETNVGGGTQLFITNTNSAGEIVNVDDNNGIRVAGGTASLDTLNFTAAALAPVARVDAGGELIINTALTSTAPIAKEGTGTLTFAYNVGAVLPANVVHNAGGLGFSGPQGFGAVAIPAGRTFQFNSDPGGAVDVTSPTGTVVVAGFAGANQLLSHINAASTGTLALGVDSGVALNFSADPTLSLGAVGLRTYTGAITPGASGYRLGGGGGELTVTTPLSGANNLTIDENGTVSLRGAQSFTGTTTVDGAGRIRVVNNDELGTATNGLTLSNGGTLELIGTVHDSTKVGAIFDQFGNPLNGQQRTITVGAGGGRINAVSFSNIGNATTIVGVNGLTGSGALTKTGYGEIFFMSSSNYSGNLILAGESGRFQIRSTGELPNVASVSIQQSAELLLNDNGGLGNRQFAVAVDSDRLNNAAPITLAGGSLSYIGSVAGTTEDIGAVTLNVGRNAFNVSRNGGTGAQMTIANLIRAAGAGSVRFGGTANTFGTTGDNGRVLFTLINGAAPAAGVVLPWATVFDDGYALHGGGAFIGVNTVTGTAVASATGFAPIANTLYNFNTATASANLTLAAGSQQLAGFRFGNGNVATNSLLFFGGADTLYVGEGVIISDNNPQTRTIGAAATRGIITAGLAGAAAGTKELFFHANQGTLAVESVVANNNGAVIVHKGTGGGTLELRATNSYSGGTIVDSGRVNALLAGSLGSGAVTVRGAAIELRQPGTTTSTAGFTILDRSELFLQNLTAVYNQPGDRFTLVGEGNMLTGGTATAGQGLASLTRVNAITAAGQIILPAGTHIRTTNAPNGVVDVNMPQNLGTNADLYFNISGGGGILQTITVGAGTPWKGLGSSVGTGWSQGAINANSDFYIQGLNRLTGNVTYALGSTGSVGGWTINNLAGKPINAFIDGRIDMNEDTPIALPSDLTFVITPGAQIFPNVSQQFGADSIGLSRARLLVQAGGTVNPGGFVGVGAAANQPFGMPYPIPSPVNTFAVFEAGGRFTADDASGLGSTTGGATWTMKKDSLLWINNGGAFLGSNAGLINNNQFVYETGAIVRLESSRIFRLDHGINNQVGGSGVILEIYNGNKDITDYVDLFNAGGAGVTTVARQVITLGAGGGITNDDADRTVNERRGTFVFNNGASLSGTTQTGLFMNESFTIAAGATVNIGSATYIDGAPKNGLVQFGSAASTAAAGAGTTLNVLAGAELSFGAVHVIPDTTAINLVAPVDFTLTAGATAPYIGNGSSILLNTANYLEIVGPLTGSGAVFSQQDGSAIGAGWGATSDFQFDGQFRSTTFTTRAPALVKVGATKMTLTGTSDTPVAGSTNSPGSLTVYQGELSLAGANGKWAGGEMRISKGGTLTFDNSVTAITDRQATVGIGNRWLTTMGGGDFRLLGHATDVADVVMFGLANSAGTAGFGLPGGNTGGYGTITVIPAGGPSLKTSVTFGSYERFDNTGVKISTWLVRGVGAGGLPGTYNSTGVYTPNPLNPVDGLTFITTPQFLSNLTYGSNGNAAGFIAGGPGTPVVPVRGDLLAASSPTATQGEFATIDIASGASRTAVRSLQASEYAATTINNSNLNLNIATGSPLTFNNGSTQFQVVKLNNGGSLNVAGVLPNLTQPAQIVLAAGGILVPSGATASLNATGDSIIRTSGGVSAYLHAFGNLNVNGTFFSDTAIVKNGPGTVTFAAGSLTDARGRLVIHEGTVNINDTLPNVRQTTGWTGPNVALDSGVLNINGKSQLFGLFESGNILPGALTEGGTLTSATPATVSIHGGGTFSGHINGSIALDKVGNNTLLLANTNSMSGNMTIRQGTILLRDSGTLPNVTTIDLNYARLDIDNGYLSGQNNRLNTGVTLNLRGADFVNRGRAATLTQETIGTMNVLQGHNLIQTLAGGGGATETIIGNIVRSAGATMTFQQNFGFVGTAGNDTTAIRYLPTLINGVAPTLVNGILPAWMIVNNDHFATYQAGKGISFLSNTEDGFLNYGGTDLSTAGAGTGTLNYNDGTAARTIPAGSIVNAIRNAPGAAQTITLSGALTIASGGLLTNANQAITYSGGTVTSGTGELNLFVQQNTTAINSVITGAIALTKAGSGTVTLGGTNTYTGITYVGQGSGGTSAPSGTLNAGATGANGTTVVAIPGDLRIHSSTVTVTVASSIKNTSNVTLYGGAILNMRDLAATTETLNSITFSNPSGDNQNRPIVTRANAQATSFLNLTGATPITITNDNATSVAAMSVNLGTVNFTAAGAQTLLINSPVTTVGNAATGLLFNANIGTVPTGIAEGGLIKSGNGLLTLGGAGTTQFGNPAVNTEVFNIQSGSVRVDNAAALGTSFAITTVQSGAALYLNTGTGITGSVRLKNGSRMGATITGSLLGAVGSTGFLDIPAAAVVQIDAFDSFLPTTNTGNVTVNHLLTGSGTINQVGIDYAAGYNGGGFLQLRNTANTFSGTINIGTNAVLEANPNDGDLSGSTFGTATINLNGGVLRVRDQADNSGSVQAITYGNNVNLNANSMLDMDRQGTNASNKTIEFGTLTVAAGTQVLNTIYGQGASITGNNYRASFTQVAGAGTLVKGGTRYVDLNGYSGFSGNIEIAGPQGLTLTTSGNLALNAATNNITNLTVRGFQDFLAGKTVTISNTLEIGNNAGQVVNGLAGITTGGNVGAVTLNNTSIVSAAVVKNNGVIGANNSASTLTSPSFRGTGLYQAYGQNLTLDGSLANDGANPTTLKVAGTSSTTAVILTASASTNTGGAQVQSGVLRVTPAVAATNPLGTGDIRVHGAAASVLAANSQPVAAQNAILEFAPASTLSQAGNITNTGTVRTSSGSTTIAGAISGTVAISSNLADFQAATVAGLLEGRYTDSGGLPDTIGGGRNLTAARLPNPGNFGVRLEPRMGQTNVVTQNGLTGWSDNTAWIYTGYFFDADGVFTFMENIDDSVLVSIDGVTRLLNNSGTNAYQTVTSTATTIGQRLNTLDTATVNTGTPQGLAAIPANPNLPAGWHSIEIRFDNGGGGAGPVAGNGFANNYGFGLNTDGTMTLDGTQALRPIDPGDGTLFRTAAGGKGNIQVEGGSTLTVGSISETALVNVGTEGTASFLNILGASSMDSLVIAGSSIVTFGAGPGPAPLASASDKSLVAQAFAGGVSPAALTAPNSLQSAFAARGAAATGSAVVPEPGSIGLLVVGSLGLLGRRRRKA